jgi:hypothetical protein
MNAFRTEWNPTPKAPTFTHDHPVLTTGSCFADRFGGWLSENKFQVLANPFCVSYQPLAIHHQLLAAIMQRSPEPLHVVEREGSFVHLDFHSAFRASDATALIMKIQETQEKVRHFLVNTRWLTITYGTAWVYDFLPTGLPVNNCQKIAGNRFRKRLLSVEEIVQSFQLLYRELKSFRPDLQLLLTVSPVRHLKDTLEGNATSKAVLRLAVHEIQQQFPNVAYFSAYEIMLDDLRDYRFYQDDLIHPNTMAENYLWDKFCMQFVPERTRQLLHQWQTVKKSLAHRPFEPTGAPHLQFLQQILAQLEPMAAVLPVSEELAQLRQKIHELRNP